MLGEVARLLLIVATGNMYLKNITRFYGRTDKLIKNNLYRVLKINYEQTRYGYNILLTFLKNFVIQIPIYHFSEFFDLLIDLRQLKSKLFIKLVDLRKLEFIIF